ncbi:class I SAM-dependent methyltransferase [Cytobacillus purgationiresistens]|uniref:Ubiquinone/menaquinone biosynthesis C-methylase UbiE n=1 Tax=Cytobacillus purgationiresistens TaxID=863449 RepID=A0ABU0ARD0_9BACI|nr:class I SAM-dependent methyltransferase [Cytobacillus purgationiresistens]MDQ0273775.1 ubiquinone/menaquinone biosynthesis C-methylase UbiE [Cytobacillus purgationiresistens]
MNTKLLSINKEAWDKAAERFYGRNPLPEYGPLAPTEEELQLFGDVSNKKVLDIGCGSGHSLFYMKQHHASELWGIDLSKSQVKAAKLLLKNCTPPVQLFESPMEINPGLPINYFDIVYSIYALGWTTNLEQTLGHIHSYLKPGGTFIFSWEHPLYNRVKHTNSELIFNQSYHDEGSYEHEAWSQPVFMQQYKISTYINALIRNGFAIDQIVEDISLSELDIERHSNRWYSYEKAQFLPTTLIIKSRKL